MASFLLSLSILFTPTEKQFTIIRAIIPWVNPNRFVSSWNNTATSNCCKFLIKLSNFGQLLRKKNYRAQILTVTLLHISTFMAWKISLTVALWPLWDDPKEHAVATCCVHSGRSSIKSSFALICRVTNQVCCTNAYSNLALYNGARVTHLSCLYRLIISAVLYMAITNCSINVSFQFHNMRSLT